MSKKIAQIYWEGERRNGHGTITTGPGAFKGHPCGFVADAGAA